MTIIFSIFWFLIFVKLLLFWLWLWQLKEYHFGRFKSHFETQKFKKIISSFWRLKYPKFTKKITAVFIACSLAEILLLSYSPLFLAIIFTFFSTSLLILFFQILAVIWRRFVMGKAKAKRLKFKDLLVIGITGSYGKTSTKEFLSAILSEKFNVLKTKEHQNSEIGISQCILNNLESKHQIFVCEMAAYNKGGIKLLCDIAKPKIGIIAGVNEQHLSTFGNMENLLSAEGGEELIDSLPKNGIAFFNGNNQYCRRLYEKTKIKKIFYGEEAAFSGEENILGSTAVARELNMTEEEIKRAVGKIDNKFPGIKIKKGINGLTVIEATYSANPTGLIAHLEFLKTFPGKKVIVMPCLIELGSASSRVHKEIGKKISEICDLAIITTKDRFKEIKEGAGEKVIFLEKSKEIFKKIISFTKKGDVVLLEGRLPNFLIEKLFV